MEREHKLILSCDCIGITDHFVEVSYFEEPNGKDGDIWFTVYNFNEHNGFLFRLKDAFKLLFPGLRRSDQKFCYANVILDKDNSEKLVKFIQQGRSK